MGSRHHAMNLPSFVYEGLKVISVRFHEIHAALSHLRLSSRYGGRLLFWLCCQRFEPSVRLTTSTYPVAVSRKPAFEATPLDTRPGNLLQQQINFTRKLMFNIWTVEPSCMSVKFVCNQLVGKPKQGASVNFALHAIYSLKRQNRRSKHSNAI